MTASSFSAMYVRNPGKAARQLAAKRQRLAEIEAGAQLRAFETVEEHQRVVDRLVAAFRDTGRCEICGHTIEDPLSVARGIGPDCWTKRSTTATAEPVTALPLGDSEESF